MKLQAKYYVYEWVRPDYNVAFYVGKGCKKRAWSMRNRNKYTTDVVNYLHKKGMKPDIRVLAHFVNEDSAYDFEAERIAFLDHLDELTNELPGGVNGGGGMKGKKHKQETIARMCVAQKGKIISLETRRKLSLANIGRTQPKDVIEKAAAKRRGQKRTLETCSKISVAVSNAKNTPEGRATVLRVATELASNPFVKEKRRQSHRNRQESDPEFWRNKLSEFDVWAIGTRLDSKIVLAKEYKISVGAVSQIRKETENKLGILPRKNCQYGPKLTLSDKGRAILKRPKSEETKAKMRASALLLWEKRRQDQLKD
jgi:hypothetical protein